MIVPFSMFSVVEPAVAGLVAGAMGAFIFGLLPRLWQAEREASPGQLGQDMIA
jgi:hypothetical protein